MAEDTKYLEWYIPAHEEDNWDGVEAGVRKVNQMIRDIDSLFGRNFSLTNENPDSEWEVVGWKPVVLPIATDYDVSGDYGGFAGLVYGKGHEGADPLLTGFVHQEADPAKPTFYAVVGACGVNYLRTFDGNPSVFFATGEADNADYNVYQNLLNLYPRYAWRKAESVAPFQKTLMYASSPLESATPLIYSSLGWSTRDEYGHFDNTSIINDTTGRWDAFSVVYGKSGPIVRINSLPTPYWNAITNQQGVDVRGGFMIFNPAKSIMGAITDGDYLGFRMDGHTPQVKLGSAAWATFTNGGGGGGGLPITYGPSGMGITPAVLDGVADPYSIGFDVLNIRNFFSVHDTTISTPQMIVGSMDDGLNKQVQMFFGTDVFSGPNRSGIWLNFNETDMVAGLIVGNTEGAPFAVQGVFNVCNGSSTALKIDTTAVNREVVIGDTGVGEDYNLVMNGSIIPATGGSAIKYSDLGLGVPISSWIVDGSPALLGVEDTTATYKIFAGISSSPMGPTAVSGQILIIPEDFDGTNMPPFFGVLEKDGSDQYARLVIGGKSGAGGTSLWLGDFQINDGEYRVLSAQGSAHEVTIGANDVGSTASSLLFEYPSGSTGIVHIERNGSDDLCFTDPNAGTKTLSQLAGGDFTRASATGKVIGDSPVTVDTFTEAAAGSSVAASWHYSANETVGGGFIAGVVTAVWDVATNSVQTVDNRTMAIGTVTGITLSITNTGTSPNTNINFVATITSGTWNIRVARLLI